MIQFPAQPERSVRNLRSALRDALVLCIFVLVAVGCGTAGDSDQKLATALGQDLNDYLTARGAVEHISTLSMTVSFRGGAPDINVATGTTQYGGGAAVTPANVFQIGSDTKAFTAVDILQLEAAGLLSINDTVGKWLPQYPQYANVTIKQLLNMTSSIPTYDANAQMLDDYGNNPMIESTLEDLVAYVYPSIKTPGEEWLYSNTGYILCQMIIDKVSPTHSYETDIDNIISKNNLHDTFYQPYFYPSSVTSRLVSGYFVNPEGAGGMSKLLGTDTSGYSLGWTQAAGGMISTPEDQARWVRALFEGDVLPPAQLQELKSLVSTKTGKSIQQTSSSDSSGFGLGVFQITDPNLGTFWTYTGSTIGYRAAYAYFPNDGLIICVFTNSQTTAEENQIGPVLMTKLYATLKTAGRA